MQPITYRMDNNKVLLYSTGNYIQYPEINHNGKGYKKNVYVHITESLLYSRNEHNIVNQLYFNLKNAKKKGDNRNDFSIKSESHKELSF